MNEKEKNQLSEEQLETATGGATQNKYDPKGECMKLTNETFYIHKGRCQGQFWHPACDHYRQTEREVFGERETIKRYTCGYGRFDFEGLSSGEYHKGSWNNPNL